MISYGDHSGSRALNKHAHISSAKQSGDNRPHAAKMRSPLFKQMDLTRGIRAARNAGCEPTSAEVRPDGTIFISFEHQSEHPELAFDKWKAKNADSA